MNNTFIIIALFFFIIIYFLFSKDPSPYHEYDKYNFTYRYEMFKNQKYYMKKITENISQISDISETNRSDGVFVIYYYDSFTLSDIEKIKNNAKNNGWIDINLPNEDNIIYASCNNNIAFNIYQEHGLKVAMYWYRKNHYCPN
ncbi:hypothetical protein [Moraxella pluranimalium]|uniref:Uncharacterized protein n=1 Tax=Moraxella pluranimalium TaxID=470453 RepID=A0A1T0CTJ4_9GAMM|nr:hypothetical protein [Moraxella pluranimalium]OOS25664.1 hypothetical protein B0680_02230 [Moraxella pluranimalium]